MDPLPFLEFIDRTPIGFPSPNRIILTPAKLQILQLETWLKENLTEAEQKTLRDLNETASRYAGDETPQRVFHEHDQRAHQFALACFRKRGINPDEFYLMMVNHDAQMKFRRLRADL